MNQQTSTLRQKLNEYEKHLIISELDVHKRLYEAADALGLPYKTLWRRMRTHGIYK